ncbi:MAG: glycosyltransferase family 4 protein [Acidimicrobiia bacterium]|nr:glycosyltransferase family 4 protein [Acidimicrobiia bacterium]
MRVLMLSWEFPPRIIGGLGRHVDRLTEALTAEGHDVFVLTRDAPETPFEEVRNRIHVHRVPEYPPQVPFEDLVSWVLQFNLGLVEVGVPLLHQKQVDVIHAHDWLVAYAACTLHNIFKVPLVSTIHATEYGRHQGWLPGDMNRLIHQVEWWLTYMSRRVVTCSTYMRDQVERIFELPHHKMDVVPNGVALRMGDGAGEAAPADPVVLFAGRLEYEKGVQTLIAAAPAIVARHPRARFEIAGDGTYGAELRRLVAESPLAGRFTFHGFVDDVEMPSLYRRASVVVAPSIYEPFGIVALEAMAAKVPVIVGDTGGLRELVADGENGLCVRPEDAGHLADLVDSVLSDPGLADRLVAGGSRDSVSRSWRAIARRTAGIYEKSIDEERELRRDSGIVERTPLRLVWGDSTAYQRAIAPELFEASSGE